MGKESGMNLPQKVKRWKGKIAQATTAAPTVGLVLENTFNGTLALGRTSAGIYTFTLTGEFSTTKTICRMTCTGAAGRLFNYAITSADVLTTAIFDAATPSAADSGNFDLEIEVYQD